MQISFGKSHWTSVAIDPQSKNTIEIGYEIEFDDISAEDDGAYIPLYIPEDTVPAANETNLLYFRTDVNANHLASFGGRLSYVLISDPDDNAGIVSVVQDIDKNFFI